MRPTTKRLSTLICLATIAGCTFATLNRSRALPPLSPPNEILVYDNGKVASERKLEPDAEASIAVADWLTLHNSGWKESLVTYAPVHLVKGDGYELNFQTSRCIANFRDNDGKWHQMIRMFNAGESEPDIFHK